MILPGISGAYILVLLGKYHFTLEAVNNRDIGTLFILTLGAAVGLLSFVRVLSWLLKRYHDLTMAVLIGLMLGSLRRIWPWKETVTTFVDSHGKQMPALQINIIPQQLNGEIVLAFLFASLGFFVVLGLHYWELKKN
jgi:putative membrane protein